MVNAQEWLEENYPENGTCIRRERKRNSNELENHQDFGKKRGEIEKLDISEKYLTGNLDLKGFDNLTKLICYNNQLTNLNFLTTLPHPKKLTKLNISHNNLTSDLSPFSKFVNLKELYLSGNCYLSTSLSPLQPCSQLERLNVYDTNLTPDLQYLPLSLQGIICDGKIAEELNLYGNNLRVWQEAHPNLMKQIGKKIVVNDYSQSKPKTITTIPKYLTEKLNQTTIPKDNYQLTNYSQFSLRDARSFAWKTKNLTTATSLPLRLYNLEVGQVETTENRKDIPHYLALSYVWGTDWEKQPQTYGQSYITDLTKLGRKALNKTIKTWELINQGQTSINHIWIKIRKLINKETKTKINHIWIDNFCINQTNPTEKGQEVAEQQQYYNQASATLIAIDGEIGKLTDKETEVEFAKHIIEQIVSSPWFKRSWTFQEGLLSKQTIFMFDDGLVDGRMLASFWGGIQNDDYWINLTTTPPIYITPLGWSYGANQKQSVRLTLSQAFGAVSHRKQTVPVDGLYSILGLLPYGNKVQTNYQTKDLNEELRKIMDLALDNGYLEPISWLGIRHVDPKLWKYPPLNKDGSTNITGFVEFKKNSIKISPTGWEFEGIKELARGDDKERGWKVGDIIIIPNYKQFKNNNKLGIILPTTDKDTRPIVFESSDWGSDDNKFFLDMVNKEVIEGEELITQYHQQLPIIQQQGQSFSLVYGHEATNETVNNSLVWQIQGQYYLVVNEQLQEVNVWKENFHPDFTDQKLIKEWTKQGWTYGEVQEWVEELENNFNPSKCSFYAWARDVKKLYPWNVKDRLTELKQEYSEQLITQIEITPKN